MKGYEDEGGEKREGVPQSNLLRSTPTFTQLKQDKLTKLNTTIP